jgi:prohibitin 1
MRVCIALLALALTGCSTIHPGEIGLRQRWGRLVNTSLEPGTYANSPIGTRIIKVNTRVTEVYEVLPLPTKEGLSVTAQIALLYHVDAERADDVYTNFGTNYQNVVVNTNFQATAREVSSRYFAKELYAIEREKVERAIAEELSAHIQEQGFVVDAVLLKDILLPERMTGAIEAKVNAEQAALQMDFVIAKQKKEAERLLIEADGIRAAQELIASSLSPALIEYNRIQMLKDLALSNNSKVIVTPAGGGAAPTVMVGGP